MMYTTCSIGGYAEDGGRRDVQLLARATRSVSASSSLPRRLALGRIVTVPDSWPRVYVVGRERCVPVPGCGYSGLGAVPWPLPFTTHSVSPASASAVGYQPTGILPARRSLPRAVVSFDATADSSKRPT